VTLFFCYLQANQRALSTNPMVDPGFLSLAIAIAAIFRRRAGTLSRRHGKQVMSAKKIRV